MFQESIEGLENLSKGTLKQHISYVAFNKVNIMTPRNRGDGKYINRYFSYNEPLLACHSGQQSRQLCSTIAETRFSYSRLFSWYSWAAWLFAGLLGFGSSKRDCMDVKMDDTS